MECKWTGDESKACSGCREFVTRAVAVPSHDPECTACPFIRRAKVRSVCAALAQVTTSSMALRVAPSRVRPTIPLPVCHTVTQRVRACCASRASSLRLTVEDAKEAECGTQNASASGTRREYVSEPEARAASNIRVSVAHTGMYGMHMDRGRVPHVLGVEQSARRTRLGRIHGGVVV
ncbi:hypothetical protein OH76DRAFT_1258098 [Lentinus brumalis]|uniref:Uncharacterized protein n=1 Tax=Lentinus brumalis TaxID=2498619 RepID=A0A371CRD1_9APHY|nr:hypothetical protein OH76DRAFT_1258098 [Polyporus brumalis]